MLNDFYSIHAWQETGHSISCELSFNAEHTIFKGHFPGHPVVPGVCTMQIAKTLLELALDRKLVLRKSSTVKFLQLITPAMKPLLAIAWKLHDQHCEATITLQNEGRAAFKMNADYTFTAGM